MLIVAIATSVHTGYVNDKDIPIEEDYPHIANLDFNFRVDLENLVFEVESDGISERASEPLVDMALSK